MLVNFDDLEYCIFFCFHSQGEMYVVVVTGLMLYSIVPFCIVANTIKDLS